LASGMLGYMIATGGNKCSVINTCHGLTVRTSPRTQWLTRKIIQAWTEELISFWSDVAWDEADIRHALPGTHVTICDQDRMVLGNKTRITAVGYAWTGTRSIMLASLPPPHHRYTDGSRVSDDERVHLHGTFNHELSHIIAHHMGAPSGEHHDLFTAAGYCRPGSKD
jgi:hypothetical protein